MEISKALDYVRKNDRAVLATNSRDGTPQLSPVTVAVVDDTVVAQPRSYLTLGFDHRVIDGAVADQFMVAVKRNLEQFDESLL